MQDNQEVAKLSNHKPSNETLLQLFHQFEKTYDHFCQRIAEDKYLNIYLEKAQTNQSTLLKSLKQIKQKTLQMKAQIQNSKQSKSLMLLITYLNDWISNKQLKGDMKLAVFALQVQVKLKVSLRIIKTVFTYPDSSITHDLQTKLNPAWKFIQFDELGTKQKISNQNSQLRKMISSGIAAKLSMDSKESWIGKQLMYPWAFSKYTLNPDWAKIKCYLFYNQPDIQFLKANAEMLESGMIRQLTRWTLPSIAHHYKFWIPVKKSQQQTNILQLNREGIPIRVHSTHKIYFTKQQSGKQNAEKINNQQKVFKKILIYYHGGGFVMGSTFMMQHITRKWAKKLQVPVFSVDYRKPPQHRFPTGPNQCYRAYQFIVTEIHKYMNVKPQQILLVGDSAGGSLSLGVTGMALKNGIQPPKGLFLIYPSTDCRFTFSPSKVNCFQDPVLSINILNLIHRQYIQSPQQQLNPLASPVLMSEQFVNNKKGIKTFPSNWPETSIIVGKKDPLFDDSLNLMDRMVEAKVPCKLRIYSNFQSQFLYSSKR